MRRTAASLAAVALALGTAGCGGDGAEPDAPAEGQGGVREVELVLDFQPNPVHAGLYAAEASGATADQGIELELRVPGDSTDAPKLLGAGRVDAAILDIHDLAIARERGARLVGIGALIQRPLAAVIADRDDIDLPSDLANATVGVTGLPSDDAVLAAVLGAGADSAAAPANKVTIGFNAVAALANDRVDAATAFWNAEGVALRELGVETREFRVEDFGAPRYPELVLVTTRDALERDPELYADLYRALESGYRLAAEDPAEALAAMLEAVPEADPASYRRQMRALSEAEAFSPPLELDRAELRRWARWDAEFGIVEQPPVLKQAFAFRLGDS